MEQALFISKADDIRFLENNYSRLYFGHEFCEILLPSPPKFREIIDIAKDRGIDFTFVTPYVTDKGIKRLIALMEIFFKKVGKGREVVINDFGFLTILDKEFEGERFGRLLGRLLTKQKRGPRLLRVMDKVPSQMVTHFRFANIDTPILTRFLKRMGFCRVELDNLLQGVRRKNDLPASLYYPYAYITTTRMCLLRDCEKEGRNFRRIGECHLECLKYTFYLRHRDMPVPIILKGNTQFYKRTDLPENLEELKIDRIVTMKGVEE